MKPIQILGILIAVAGVVLLVLGINATDSLGEEVREGLTGQYSDTTRWYIVGGAVGIVLGGLLALLPAFGRNAR